MSDIFYLRNAGRLSRQKYNLTLEVPKTNHPTFGARSLRSFGPKMWNALPYNIKSSENFSRG